MQDGPACTGDPGIQRAMRLQMEHDSIVQQDVVAAPELIDQKQIGLEALEPFATRDPPSRPERTILTA
jgi:hypothetical protein